MQTFLIVLFISAAIVLVILRLIYDPDREVTEIDSEVDLFQVVITPEELVCEHPKREREAVPWGEIHEIVLITTREDPLVPDQWLIFVGNVNGCSIPTEANGIHQLWEEIGTRFPGFNFHAMKEAGTVDTNKSVWRRPEVAH
jgi:hypothetical protein